MQGSRARLVERVADAFTRGLSCSSSRSTPAALSEFAKLVDDSISRAIPPSEWSFIRSCLSVAEQSLQAARQDRLEEAREQSDAVRTRIRAGSPSLSPEGQMLVEVFLKPGYAYLRYKLGDYDGARKTIRRISALDHKLVTESGLVCLGAHRLQLAGNLLRIHTRLGERIEAMQLGETLLDYLELRIEPTSSDLLSAREVLDSIPGGIAEYYFEKIAGELALFLAGSCDADSAQLFRPLVRHAESHRCLHGFAPCAHAWMRMKHLALNSKIDTFQEMAIDQLEIGTASMPSLWFATVIEVVELYRLGGGDAAALADRMVAEASQLSDAPWELKRVAQPC